MARTARRHALDGIAARVVAVGVALTAGCGLLAIHWEDLTAGETAQRNDPVARCIAERSAIIDRSVADGTFTADQAALFKQRATGQCRAGPPG